MDLERDHRRRSFELFALVALALSVVLLAVRLATPPIPEADLFVLVSIALLSGGALWKVRRGGGADCWSKILLAWIAGSGLTIHALLPAPRFVLEMLGVIVVLASLLLGPRAFVVFSAVLLGAAGLSRGVRIAGGMAESQPLIGLLNIVGGYLVFGLALFVLDRQHREAAQRLTAATERSRQARDAALRAIDAKTRFLANMSHELRTPLNAILGYSELLDEEVDEADEESHELLGRIQAAGTSLLGRLDEVLETACSEAMSGDPDYDLDAKVLSRWQSGPSAVDGLERLERDRVAWWVPVVAGGVGLLVALVHVAASVFLGVPVAHGILAVTGMMSVTVVALGFVGRPVGGLMLLTLCGAVLVAVSAAAFPQSTDLAPYVYFLCAVAAILLRPREQTRAMAAVVLAMGVGYGVRYVATGDFEASIIPALGVVFVAAELVAMGRRRQDHRIRLAEQARSAEMGQGLAEAAEAARTTFLERMSHDIRTPLTTIAGYGDLRVEDLPEPFHDDLNRIRRAADHLGRIVDDLLDMATIAKGSLTCEPVTCDLGALCRDAVDLARPYLGSCQLALSVPEARVGAYADPVRTSQIVVNLLTNAGKYAAGASVTLQVSVVANAVQVQVIDTGPGIPPEALDRLFEPFERLRPDPSVGGSGLGLAISRHLARMQGGDLTAASSYGCGSTFTLTLPTRSAA